MLLHALWKMFLSYLTRTVVRHACWRVVRPNLNVFMRIRSLMNMKSLLLVKNIKWWHALYECDRSLPNYNSENLSGDEPLPIAMATKISVALRRHQATMNYIIRWQQKMSNKISHSDTHQIFMWKISQKILQHEKYPQWRIEKGWRIFIRHSSSKRNT